jgi:GT2 family glycosyltransferase
MTEVSVIIPTHNRGVILVKTIWSYVCEQSVCEVIVVNDGSTDNTEELLKDLSAKEPKIRVFSKENGGAPSARNYGINKVSVDSNYIFFGEDDAFLEEGAIDKLLGCMKAENADIVGGRIVPIDSVDSELACVSGNIVEEKPVRLNIMRANFKIELSKPVVVPFVHALFLAKKWIFQKVRFDEAYFGNAYREETDFCVEATKTGAKIVYCSDSRLFHIEAPQGGQRRNGKLAYEIAILKNNWYFLNKQYNYLKKRYRIITPKVCLQGALILRRIYLLLFK